MNKTQPLCKEQYYQQSSNITCLIKAIVSFSISFLWSEGEYRNECMNGSLICILWMNERPNGRRWVISLNILLALTRGTVNPSLKTLITRRQRECGRTREIHHAYRWLQWPLPLVPPLLFTFTSWVRHSLFETDLSLSLSLSLSRLQLCPQGRLLLPFTGETATTNQPTNQKKKANR